MEPPLTLAWTRVRTMTSYLARLDQSPDQQQVTFASTRTITRSARHLLSTHVPAIFLPEYPDRGLAWPIEPETRWAIQEFTVSLHPDHGIPTLDLPAKALPLTDQLTSTIWNPLKNCSR